MVSTKNLVLMCLGMGFISCSIHSNDSMQNPNRSNMSSITMLIPDQIKPYVADGRLDAYNLAIVPGACDDGVVGKSIMKVAQKIDISSGKLSDEKLVRGCAYTLTMSLGKSDKEGSKLEKIYLTNDQDGKRTEISAAQTKFDKIKISALLYVTAEGKSDLKIEGQQIEVSSPEYSDVDIGVDIGEQAGDFSWQSVLKVVNVANVGWSGDDLGSPFYRDIMSHSQRKLENQGATTNAHETQHFLNNAVREATRGVKDNVIYVGNGKAGLILEPAMKPSEARAYVPAELKKVSRYETYMVKQIDNYWSNEALYIFDEWSGYRADLRVAIEMIKAGKGSAIGNEICIGDGAAEFLHFGSSVVAALKVKEPAYLTNMQFKAAYALLAEESVKYIKLGAGDRRIDCDAVKLLNHFVSSPEAAKNREVIREWMGQVWTKRVLGF